MPKQLKIKDDLFGDSDRGRTSTRPAPRATGAEAAYTAADIEVLEGLEPVRRRPGMHSGGKFDSKVYETSGGLHGVGVSVVNALSSRLEVEVARGQKLYRMAFERGHPKGKLEDLGKINNRRGTRIRFRPDAQIFGGKASFKPQRLFKMTRSKAYLFGGVEIRWRCDGELLKGIDDVPAEDSFHFPGGLKDFLGAAIHNDTLVQPDIFSGKSGRNGAHGACEWAVAWTADADGFLSSYCNTVPT